LNDIELKGCTPVPLAHYLKALGILRLVSEQKDPDARGYWKNDRFHIVTNMSDENLLAFFLEEYRPTPIVSPWNGGSGFGPSDYQDAIVAIANSTSIRYQEYRNTITVARKIRAEMGIKDKVDKGKKEQLLLRCRNEFSEEALRWLDATYILTDDGAKYPPILGTGGNDGRLDFSKNFMQNLSVYVGVNNDSYERSRIFIRNSLFVDTINDLDNNAIGQFFPSAVGGANAQAGFESNSNMNPWDYILMVEGALFFASACSKKMKSVGVGTLSYPFSVRTVAVGYGSSSKDDESNSRPEIWMPIWKRPTSSLELKTIFTEGRSVIGRRDSQTGIDFARSIATLGVDRGIEEFHRYGFMVRNGLAYFATPIGRFQVQRQPQVDLINEIDTWLNIFRTKSSTDKTPASIVRVSKNLDKAILDLCTSRSPLKMQAVLINLGHCEKEMINSSSWTGGATKLKPVPYLSKTWLKECDDGTVEFRLAAGLSSVYGRYGESLFSIRRNIEPVIEGSNPFFKFKENRDANEAVGTSGELTSILNSIMYRRLVRAQQKGCENFPDRAAWYVHPGDIADFIEGRVNDEKIIDLLWGMILINWREDGMIEIRDRDSEQSMMPDASYMLMKICHSDVDIDGKKIPVIPQIHRLASGGDGKRAMELALRRLRSSGVSPVRLNHSISQARSKRIAAALLFPVRRKHMDEFIKMVSRPKKNAE